MTRRMVRRLAAVVLVVSPLCLVADVARAARVRLRATMEHFGGNPAFLAIYVADAKGRYVTTVQIYGDKAQYYYHLPRWFRGVGPQAAPLDGVTGASVGSGSTLDVSVDIADALIDAGYELRVDSAVEKLADEPAEIVLPLSRTATNVDF
jgi:hypothetical protein